MFNLGLMQSIKIKRTMGDNNYSLNDILIFLIKQSRGFDVNSITTQLNKTK